MLICAIYAASMQSVIYDTLAAAVYIYINPCPAEHDYSRFYSVLLVDQITVIGNEMHV